MPRAAQQRRDTQAPPEYRTETRRASGFQPAQRTIPPRPMTAPPREDVFRDEEEEVRRGPVQPVTKSGFPDRRFRGQRDLPPPPEEESGTRARTGGTVGNMHVTIDGKPDRRFKENRSMSEEELTARWLDEMNRQYGRK